MKNKLLGELVTVFNKYHPSITHDNCLNWVRSIEQRSGYIVFTVMALSLDLSVAKRIFSSHNDAFPVSGEKPIMRNDWFKQVVENKTLFCANQPEQMGDQFPDIDLIKALGCGSVLNVPIIISGKTVAVANILHRAGFFTPAMIDATLDALAPIANSTEPIGAIK